MRIAVIAFGLFGLAAVAAPLLQTSTAQEASSSKGDPFDKKTWLAVAPGRVEPRSGEIRIGSPAVGRIGEILVKVNDAVFAGEVLIRLDDDEARIRHAKAEAQVSLRKRSRAAAQGKSADRRKLDDATADAERAVARARSAVDQAAAKKRTDNGNDDALAAARKALAEAQARLRDRRAELVKFDADNATTPTELDIQLTMARLELRGAEAALDSLAIRSPIAGTVLQVNVRLGELASPSAQPPLVVVGDISALRVRAEVDERDFGEIRIGHPVVVRSPAFRGREIAGKVSSIAPIIEPGRIGARGQRNVTDVNVTEVMVDLVEPGPLAVGMKVDVYFSRDNVKR